MSSSILSFGIVRQSPFSDDPDWYYILHSPSGNLDLCRLYADGPQPTPSLAIDLNFVTQTISSFRNYSDEQELPSTTETKRFMLDIREFNQRFSAEQVINSMFMNTSTGRTLSIERRRWLVSDISDHIVSFIRDGICVAYNEIFISLDVVELVQDEDLNGILQESFEDAELSDCPAPQALLESLVTEVFLDEEEVVNCMICLEELVAGTEVKRLPCSHRFHGHCIDGWFARRGSCPLCRLALGA